eukprot:12928373-Prorocentrum_lima.AAC.1
MQQELQCFRSPSAGDGITSKRYSHTKSACGALPLLILYSVSPVRTSGNKTKHVITTRYKCGDTGQPCLMLASWALD